jgi:serine/threonine protein phosphatase PrpC
MMHSIGYSHPADNGAEACDIGAQELGGHLRRRAPKPPNSSVEARGGRPWAKLGKGGGGHRGEAYLAASPNSAAFSSGGGTFITIDHEAIQDEGEDAKPLLHVRSDDAFALGVFDGLGGAGGARYEIEGTERKGAYVASRLAREVASREVEKLVAAPVTDLASAADTGEQFATRLAERLQIEFQRVASLIEGEPSSLRGPMMRVLPTTAAIAVVWSGRDTDDGVRGSPRLGCAVWAGDSRVYVLSPLQGLVQVSSDDARVRGDALSSLESDPPIDNCISASQDFRLNAFAWELQEPSIVFAATDGCFGYLPTPAHFEMTLLEAMSGAVTAEDWQRNLLVRIASVARDDATLVAGTLGFGHFQAARDAFGARGAYVMREFVDPYSLRHDMVTAADRELAALKHRRDELADARSKCAQELWERYRPTYEQLLATRLGGPEIAP